MGEHLDATAAEPGASLLKRSGKEPGHLWRPPRQARAPLRLMAGRSARQAEGSHERARLHPPLRCAGPSHARFPNQG